MAAGPTEPSRPLPRSHCPAARAVSDCIGPDPLDVQRAKVGPLLLVQRRVDEGQPLNSSCLRCPPRLVTNWSTSPPSRSGPWSRSPSARSIAFSSGSMGRVLGLHRGEQGEIGQPAGQLLLHRAQTAFVLARVWIRRYFLNICQPMAAVRMCLGRRPYAR